MKKKLIGGIVLFFIFAGAMTAFILLSPSILHRLKTESQNDRAAPYFFMGLFALAIMVIAFIANRLIASYRNGSGDKGVLSTLFYVLTLIGCIAGIAFVGIVILIIWLVKKIMEDAPSTTTSSSPARQEERLKIKDERGFDRTLKEYDRYGGKRYYRDDLGNRWSSSDSGKTVNRE